MKLHSVIIGGTRGVGRVLTRLMKKRGHRVSVVGRQKPASDKACKGVSYWAADIACSDERREAFRQLVRKNGKITHLIFSHRYRGTGDAWKGEMETSVAGTRATIEELTPFFDNSGQGSIVLVSSVAGSFVSDDQPVGYHVAKASINQMIRYYAVTLGRKGIRVNGVSPFTFLKDESKKFFLKDRKRLRMYENIIPLGRMGTAEDVARAILFLCSPDAAFISGQNIFLDGGLSARWPESVARQLQGGTGR